MSARVCQRWVDSDVGNKRRCGAVATERVIPNMAPEYAWDGCAVHVAEVAETPGITLEPVRVVVGNPANAISEACSGISR